MPLFTNVGRGNLVLSKEKVIKPGKVAEMSQEEADSLPPGTVEPVAKPVEPKKEK